ncbi:hypothetical protein LTR56_020186 [Elasticomyces elasticus]|nr:hypothetical protein LTR56_020186 [Elasticomyces elasticus]KAK3663610.1 hypothetical protein LTR22_005550 [Elasticomyces elasticus]KAK4921730.1 hypothetical protein LTR49_010836 [Elasticomyces elasticus]KAK5764194.1 hypothetical protein LTS12_005645 [Elasticomyces elasticus]
MHIHIHILHEGGFRCERFVSLHSCLGDASQRIDSFGQSQGTDVRSSWKITLTKPDGQRYDLDRSTLFQPSDVAIQDGPSIDGKGWSNPPSVALNPNTQATPVDREALKLHQFSENKIPQRDVSSTTSTSVVTPPVSTSPASSVPSSHSPARSSAIATAPTGRDWYPWAALHTVAPPACGKPGKKFKATG